MMESYSVRGWVVPRVQERERLNKPPMIYWTQAISAGILTGWDSAGDAIWMYRIPSLLGAIITIMATWRIGCVLFPGAVGARTGLLAGFLLAAAPIFAWEARQARADQLLVMWTTLAMWLLAKAWRDRDRTQPWMRVLALWVVVGGGVLTKGPITPMVGGLAILALCWWTRSWRWTLRLRPIVGAVIVVAMVLPWVLLVGAEIGFGKYWSIVYDEILGRSLAPKEGHWGPPGYHTLLVFALFLPGAMLLGAAVWRTVARNLRLPAARMPARGRVGKVLGVVRRIPRMSAVGGHHGELFLLAWVIPSWLVFEFVSTKLPHYTMPLYPALALLTARCVYAVGGGFVEGLDRGLARIGILTWAVFGLGTLVFGPFVLETLTGGAARHQLVLILVASAVLLVSWMLACAAVWRRDLKQAQTLGLATACASIVVLLGAFLPNADTPFVSKAIAEQIRLRDPGGTRSIASVGFHEDSLIFNTHGRVERIDEDQLDAWIVSHPDAIVILPLDLANREDLVACVSVVGFNYSNGKRGTWVVARVLPET